MASGSPRKSPVSSSPCDEVPHIFSRKSRLRPAKFSCPGAKRLLQHNRPNSDLPASQLSARYGANSGRLMRDQTSRVELSYERTTLIPAFAGMNAVEADAGFAYSAAIP